MSKLKYRIRELRERKGMSQEMLSEKAGVSREIISRLETGRSDQTTVRTLEKISNALDEDIVNIFLA